MAHHIIASVKDVFRILRAPLLSSSARWRLARARMRLAGGGDPAVVALGVGHGSVFLDLAHRPDVAVAVDIFVRERYQGDYRDAVVLDLGAHKGCFTAYAFSRGAAAVIGFEPEADNFRALQQTVATFEPHGCQAIMHQKAIAVTGGEVSFYVTNQSWSHSLVKRTDREVVSVNRVAAYPFDDAVRDARALAGRRRVVVKMDVEGAEGEILLNCHSDSLAEIDELFVEVHRFGSYSVDELAARLDIAGLEPASEDSSRVWRLRRRAARVGARAA